nr:putative capsid protein [Crucivirus sp.]
MPIYRRYGRRGRGRRTSSRRAPVKRRRTGGSRRPGYFSTMARRFGGAGASTLGRMAAERAAAGVLPAVGAYLKDAAYDAAASLIPGGGVIRRVYKGVKRYWDGNADMMDEEDKDPVGPIARVDGPGAYTIRKNSLMSGSQTPAMHSVEDGVRIRHREYVQDVKTATAFTNQTFVMNPGLAEVFPWLSAIAQNFEEYEWLGLMVHFKSTCSDAIASSTNLALGTMILAAEYNVNQAAYVNKQQMENSYFAMSSKPSCDMLMPVECDPKDNPLAVHYIRTGAVPSGQDARMYDMCNVQLASVGAQAAFNTGELWITYDVILRKPQLDSGLALAAASAHYSLVAPAVTTAYFGTSQVAKYDSIGLTVTGTAFSFPIGQAGVYLVSWSARGASTASLVAPTTTLTNCTALQIWANDAATSMNTLGSPTSTIVQLEFVISITDPNQLCTVTLSAGTLCGTPTYGDLIVTQINGNLNS